MTKKKQDTSAKALQATRRSMKKEVHAEWAKKAELIKKIIKSSTITKNEKEELVNIFIGHIFSYRYGDLEKADKLDKELKQLIIKTEKKLEAIGIAGTLCVIILATLMILHILGVV